MLLWSIPLARPRRYRELLVPATESIQDAPWKGEGTWPCVLGTLRSPVVARPPAQSQPGGAELFKALSTASPVPIMTV